MNKINYIPTELVKEYLKEVKNQEYLYIIYDSYDDGYYIVDYVGDTDIVLLSKEDL